MKPAEYGKLSSLRSLYSVNSIQATLERKLSDIIKTSFLESVVFLITTLYRSSF